MTASTPRFEYHDPSRADGTTTDTTDCLPRALCVNCATSTDGECWRRSWWCPCAANLLLNTRTPVKESIGVERRRCCACLCHHHASCRRRHSRRRLSLPPANVGITKTDPSLPLSRVGIATCASPTLPQITPFCSSLHHHAGAARERCQLQLLHPPATTARTWNLLESAANYFYKRKQF